jgi:hypothetical protein
MKPEYDTSKFRCCGTHGLMPIDQFAKGYLQRKNGKRYPVYKCKECLRIKSRLQYKKDPKADHAQTNKWRRAHREETRAIVNRSYQKNKEKVSIHSKQMIQEVRLECLKAYSEEIQCKLCGEAHDEFLILDHIDGGGTQHRKEVGRGSNFYDWIKKNNFPSGYRVLCHNCNFKESLKQNYNNIDLKQHMKRKGYKIKCFSHYSDTISCACCNCSDIEVLSIDHINGGGRNHLKELGISGGYNFYGWLKKNDYPSGYQILCLNCNSAKSHGQCPHQHCP